MSGRRSRPSAAPRAVTPLSPGGPPPPDVPITEPRIENFLLDLMPSTEPVLLEMERQAREEKFPIVGPLVGRLLRQLTLSIGGRDVFEMGSGFGYSTFFLAQAVGEGGRVVYSDRSPERLERARALLAQAGLEGRVTFERGDALELIVNYPGPFDLIFIDVDKAAYPEALELARARVRPGGFIVVDNALWYGRVLEGATGDPGTQGVLRYLQAAMAAPDLSTTVLPLRDGVGLHLKLPEPRRRR